MASGKNNQSKDNDKFLEYLIIFVSEQFLCGTILTYPGKNVDH